MKKLTTIAILFMTACTFSVAAGLASGDRKRDRADQATASTDSTHQKESKWVWQHRDNDTRLEVTIRGRVEFTEDYKEIKSISDNGSIRIIDERGGVYRKFEAEQTSAGIKRSYWVEGQLRPLDSEARAWLAKILEETVVQGGYDARPRARKIISERGPAALLDEISKIKGDYVKGIYFQELVSSGTLNAEIARQAIEQAGRQIRSDYELANVLMKVGEPFFDNEAVQSAYLAAVETISSSYERGRVLSAVLKRGNLSDGTLRFIIKIAAGISSDYEKTQVLLKVAANPISDEATRAAYFEAAGSIRSDYERSRALSGMLKEKETGKQTLLLAVKTAASISSDYEKARVLLKVARINSDDEAVRAALIDAAKTIKSEYERGRVFSAVFR